MFKPHPIIGVDEAGRGCLAGPVFASAVILQTNDSYPDSKQVSPTQRKKLAKEIMHKHIATVGKADVEEIDKQNILQATFLAMKRALAQLPKQTGHVLVDGHLTIPGLSPSFHQTAFVKGDRWFAPIAAASIIAKVKRDEWISQQDQHYPQYGFSDHKGYPTSEHRKNIALHGPCPLHRKTFAGVKEYF